MTLVGIPRVMLVAILLAGPAITGHGADPAPSVPTNVPAFSRTAEAGAVGTPGLLPVPAMTGTVASDAERLAHAEAEIALLKQTRAAERARPQWWEVGCMGCLSVATVLLILGAIVL